MSAERTRNPVCEDCGEGKLYRQKRRRYPPAVVVAGFVLLAPALWAASTGLYTFLGSLFMGPTMVSDGSEAGFFAARAGILRILIPGLAGTALGAWLVSKRPTSVCNRCGASAPSGVRR